MVEEENVKCYKCSWVNTWARHYTTGASRGDKVPAGRHRIEVRIEAERSSGPCLGGGFRPFRDVVLQGCSDDVGDPLRAAVGEVDGVVDIAESPGMGGGEIDQDRAFGLCHRAQDGVEMIVHAQLCAAPLRETRWQRVSGPAPTP
jgi:hypothetical protein